jgi:hypothetical protein
VAFIGQEKSPPNGALGFPLIGQGKDPGYKSKREKGRKMERNDGVDSPGAAPSFPPRAGPADDNGGVHML